MKEAKFINVKIGIATKYMFGNIICVFTLFNINNFTAQHFAQFSTEESMQVIL